jgi:hypothetical protein
LIVMAQLRHQYRLAYGWNGVYWSLLRVGLEGIDECYADEEEPD